MTLSGPIAPSILKTHPLTGAPIEPVGMIGNKYVWPVMGGAPKDADDDDDDKDDDNDDGDSGADDDADDDDTGSSGSKGDDDDDDDDREALKRRMKAADKRAAAAEKRLKDAENAKKDDLTRATDELTETKEKVTELTKTVNSLRLQNSFLTANKQKWHDPDTALDLAQSRGYLDDVVDEDTGEVDKSALSKALDRLAKDKPFLVDKGKANDDGDDDEPSGRSAGRRSDNSKDDKARKDALKRRMPVLNR